MVWFVTIGLIAYCIGSLPAGYLAGRMGGIDIRKVGSGNVGATNVTRVLGKRVGYPVFLVDFCKGLVAVLLAQAISHRCGLNSIATDLCVALAGIFSVVG